MSILDGTRYVERAVILGGCLIAMGIVVFKEEVPYLNGGWAWPPDVPPFPHLHMYWLHIVLPTVRYPPPPLISGPQRVLCLDCSDRMALLQLETLHQIERSTGKSVIDSFDWIVAGGTTAMLLMAMLYGMQSLCYPRFQA